MRFISTFISFFLGVLIGGYVLMDTQPRAVFHTKDCTQCLSSSEFLGLLGSIAVQKTPAILPIILETDRSVVIEHPLKKMEVHYVIIPKKDIKSPSELGPDDSEYLEDIFSVMHTLIKKDDLQKYKITSNGPGYQQVNYLHFHLTGIRGKP